MIEISIYKQSNYPISATLVKKKLKEVLEREGIVSDFTVSIAFVGEKKMEELVDKYYKGDPEKLYVHPILTFPAAEVTGEFVTPKKQKPDLGEIIISYLEVVNISKETGKLIDDVIVGLIEHGCQHLLGKHHS